MMDEAGIVVVKWLWINLILFSILIEKFNKKVKLPPNSKGCFQCGKYLIWLNK
jgi:hypothetical protein